MLIQHSLHSLLWVNYAAQSIGVSTRKGCFTRSRRIRDQWRLSAHRFSCDCRQSSKCFAGGRPDVGSAEHSLGNYSGIVGSLRTGKGTRGARVTERACHVAMWLVGSEGGLTTPWGQEASYMLSGGWGSTQNGFPDKESGWKAASLGFIGWWPGFILQIFCQTSHRNRQSSFLCHSGFF